MLTLKNKMGVTKQVKVGYGWTSLFFGLWIPIYRQDWKGFFRQLLLAMLTFGLGNLLYVPFVYNKKYVERLIDEGYEVVK